MNNLTIQSVEINSIGKQLSTIGGPVADPEALVGSLMGQPWVKEKVRELSILSLSSVPSTILRIKTSVSLGSYGVLTV